MYWFSMIAIVAPRMTRDAPADPRIPSAMITLTRPGPITAMIDRITTRNGKDCQASTTRCTQMSYLPL